MERGAGRGAAEGHLPPPPSGCPLGPGAASLPGPCLPEQPFNCCPVRCASFADLPCGHPDETPSLRGAPGRTRLPQRRNIAKPVAPARSPRPPPPGPSRRPVHGLCRRGAPAALWASVWGPGWFSSLRSEWVQRGPFTAAVVTCPVLPRAPPGSWPVSCLGLVPCPIWSPSHVPPCPCLVSHLSLVPCPTHPGPVPRTDTLRGATLLGLLAPLHSAPQGSAGVAHNGGRSACVLGPTCRTGGRGSGGMKPKATAP